MTILSVIGFIAMDPLEALIGYNNAFLLANLLGFLGGFGGLWLVTRFLHDKEPVYDTMTTRRPFDWGRYFYAVIVWFLLTTLLELVFYAMNPDNYEFQLNLKPFLILLVISLLLLPIQTALEEWLMRGYLMQAISLISKYRVIPLIITTAFFAVLHGANPEIAEYGTGIMMSYYVGVGLFLGILTLMDDGLELAMGIHFVNNFYGAVMVTFPSSALSTDAVFRINEMNAEHATAGWLLMAVITFIILNRKYQFMDWRKVVGKVDLEND